MRKLTVEIEPSEGVRNGLRATFSNLRSYAIMENLKTDYERGLCIELIECTLRDGVSIHDMSRIGNMEILDIIGSSGNTHTCLIKYKEPKESLNVFKEWDLDLIHATPTVISEDRFILSVIGEPRNLRKFVQMIGPHVGRVVNMSIRNVAYRKQDILSILTGKQRKVLIAAYKHGYYDYPKRISSKRLSMMVGLSKPTMLQHLRKTEGRILEEILAGRPEPG
jgi:predicted DNA binding protein